MTNNNPFTNRVDDEPLPTLDVILFLILVLFFSSNVFDFCQITMKSARLSFLVLSIAGLFFIRRKVHRTNTCIHKLCNVLLNPILYGGLHLPPDTK